MRAGGYALSELLVAVAIAGLIIGVLTFLNVDYVRLGRRVSELQGPYELGAHLQRLDPCASPGAVLTAEGDKVVARTATGSDPLISLASQEGGPTQVITANGVAGASGRPVRLVVEATPTPAPAPAASMAAVELGGATAGVVSPRCEASQVCDYDAANAVCLQDEVTVAEPG